MRKLVVKGGTIEQEYPLCETTIIGRASSSTIRLDGQKIADEHAKISKTGPNLFVEDLDTPHGITVNGKKVARWALKKGDLIGVGAITLLYDEDDKPEPAPKPKPPPIPEGQKSATNITPAKSSAPSKSATKAGLPAVNGNGKSAANMPAAKSQDSAKSVDAAKSKDSTKAVAPEAKTDSTQSDAKGDEPKPAEPKPVQPKPVESKPAGSSHSSARSVPAIPSAKSSALLAAVMAKSGTSGRHSAKSSQALTAVGPGSLNAGNSSRINIQPSKSVGGTSSAGLGAVSASGSKSGIRSAASPGSKSGILSASSARLRPGLSGQLPAVSGSDSSARMNAASAAALIAQRMANTPAGGSGTQAAVTNLPAPKTLLIAVGVLCFLVLVLGGVLIATLARKSGPTTEEKAAMQRLHAKGPKVSDDLQFVTQRLRAVHTVSDVEEILGEPDLKFTGEIPLWDPQMGTTKYPGPAFFAYYIADQNQPSAIEESPVANVLLFLITDTKAEFMGPRKYARFPAGPEKKAETHTGNPPANVENPPPMPPMPRMSPKGAPRTQPPTPPMPPTLPLSDDKPPTAEARKH